MSWRTVVISRSAKLDLQLGSMVVRSNETIRVQISELALVVIESTAVSLTSALLAELIKQKVKVIFCDEKHNPISELCALYGAFDASDKVKKQMAWTDYSKKLIWTSIIREKIQNQAKLLKKYNHGKEELLHGYIKELGFGDVTNREGHAAKVYFNALFGKDFSRTQDNSINAALDYGYSIILAMINREVVSNGYLTQVGVFHDNVFNQFNLSSDLIEPFRTLVDDLVYTMAPKKFEKEEKYTVLTILQKEVFINNRKEVVSNAIKIYVKSVLDALNNEDSELIKFYKNEL